VLAEPRFVAMRCARGARAQTIAGWLLRGAARPPFAPRSERLATPDGDFVELTWLEREAAAAAGADDARDERPLALLLHGLEGSPRSGYVATLARELSVRGVGSVALAFRGCGGEPNQLPRAYHAGETGDLAFVVATLRARFPARALAVVGASLGGNVALRWLGELGEAGRTTVSAAAVVSVPFDLAAGADHSASGPGRLFADRLVRSLRAKAAAKAQQFGPLGQLGLRVDVARAVRAATFREFDDAFTAPLHGFRDADDYYARSSSAPWLARIAVPTCIVHARDDPFLPAAAIPLAALRDTPSITAHLSDHGGHVGFLAGSPWSPRLFAEPTIAQFLADHLSRR